MDILPADFEFRAIGAQVKVLAYKAWPAVEDHEIRVRFIAALLRDRLNHAAAERGFATAFDGGFNRLRPAAANALEQLESAMPIVVHGSSKQPGSIKLRAGEVAAGILLAGMELHTDKGDVTQSDCIELEMHRLKGLMGAGREGRDLAHHWNTHRPVAHLWAASLLGPENKAGNDVSAILLFAEQLADVASQIEWGRGRRLLDPETSWRLPPTTREWLSGPR